MPTLFTAGVRDGTITSFKEYALLCARHFGACISLKEEPLKAEVPKFKPDKLYEKAVIEAEEMLKELNKLSALEIKQRCEEYNRKRFNSYVDSAEEKKLIISRYNKMIEKAKKFEAPTLEHKNYADFIVKQLEESKEYNGYTLPKPEPISPEDWYKLKIELAKDNLARSKDRLKNEKQRVEENNAWVNALKEELSKPKYSE